jgi:hypothetical protein
MRQAITAALIQFEMTTYNDDGQVVKRPDVKFMALEAEIPVEVREWLMFKAAQGGN